MPELSEAYVIGLLADLERQVPAMQRELDQARMRAGAVDAELSNLVRRLDASKAALAGAQDQVDAAVEQLTDRNLRIASLHQGIAGLKRRSEDIKTEMERVGPGAIAKRLRRERAKLSVQIDDREAEVQSLRGEVESLRQQLQQGEESADAERDRSRAIIKELDKLQEQLPSPYLFAGLFERTAARAHCRFYLDGDPGAWQGELRQDIRLMTELHEELRAGKYRLDKNSDIVGGRAMATAEAIYGAAALGDRPLAQDLFAAATDPGLFFHQIFNVFRVWCLGLYLQGRTQELGEMLRLHQFAPGLRGGYAQAFIGLVLEDEARVNRGLEAVARHEWEIWTNAVQVRGAGVVNLGGLAISRLAIEAGLRILPPGPTVPLALLPLPRLEARREPTAIVDEQRRQ